jgi:hypothetical protein
LASSPKNIIIILVFIAVATGAYFMMGFVDHRSQVNEVVFEVVYGGSFNVTIIENGQVKTSAMYGLGKMTLFRIGSGTWVLEATVRKLDSDTGTLYVYFKSMDGEILASDSTSESFGTASISLIL